MSAAIRCRPRLWFLAAALALGGCALNYMDVMRQVDQDLASQKPDAALKALDKLAGGGDQALYLLNKAMVLRMTGDYATRRVVSTRNYQMEA